MMRTWMASDIALAWALAAVFLRDFAAAAEAGDVDGMVEAISRRCELTGYVEGWSDGLSTRGRP